MENVNWELIKGGKMAQANWLSFLLEPYTKHGEEKEEQHWNRYSSRQKFETCKSKIENRKLDENFKRGYLKKLDELKYLNFKQTKKLQEKVWGI